MVKRCLQHSQIGSPRNMGPAVTAGTLTLTTPQLCTHRPCLKWVQANACPCRSAICPCTSGYQSDNCHKQGPTRGPTAPRLATNVSETIKEAQEAALTLLHAISTFIFNQDAPELSPNVLPRGDKWPALPARTNAAHAAPGITKTAAPDPATTVTIGIGKIN